MAKELSLKAQVAEVVILLVPLVLIGALSWWLLRSRSAIPPLPPAHSVNPGPQC